MDESARPAVEAKPPPMAVLKVANAVLRRGLQSPLHRAIGKDLMLLHVRGRKTGRIYVVPVVSGVGARLGVNFGYIKFTTRKTWNPF